MTRPDGAVRPAAWLTRGPRWKRPFILAFHEVHDPKWLGSFVRALGERGEIVALGDFVDRHHAGTANGREIVLTFDDGYRSVRSIVEPTLTELAAPFTTFVCGEVVAGGPAPWFHRVSFLVDRVGCDDLARRLGFASRRPRSTPELVHALKEAPLPRIHTALERAEAELGVDTSPLRGDYMAAEDLRQLAANPLATIGSHSHRHPILSRIPAEDQATDLRSSLETISATCGRDIRYLAYPNGQRGDFDTCTIETARDCGIVAAVTTEQRPVRPTDDPMVLPRLGVAAGDSVERLDVKRGLPWVSLGGLREAWFRRVYRRMWSA